MALRMKQRVRYSEEYLAKADQADREKYTPYRGTIIERWGAGPVTTLHVQWDSGETSSEFPGRLVKA